MSLLVNKLYVVWTLLVYERVINCVINKLRQINIDNLKIDA